MLNVLSLGLVQSSFSLISWFAVWPASSLSAMVISFLSILCLVLAASQAFIQHKLSLKVLRPVSVAEPATLLSAQASPEP